MEVAIGVVIVLLAIQTVLAGMAYRQWRIDASAEPVAELDPVPTCNHKWRIENKDTIPSAWPQLEPWGDECATTKPLEWLFRTTIATTYICITCGEMRTETARNYEPKS